MKGIIAIKNQKGRILGYNASQNIEETMEYYKTGDNRWKRYMENHPNAQISYEVLEITDTPEIDVLKYKLPQVSRVEYDPELLEAVAYKIGQYRSKTLRKVADWFCETYPSPDTLLRLFLSPDGMLEGTIKTDTGESETYYFSKSGKPTPAKE